MYCDFYQLTERPFNVTPDPKFLYLNARYREALASLNYGITQRKGFITLIGEAGTGKTTLLKKLLEDLDSKTRSVFIFNTNVTFEEILEYIFAEFDLPVHNGKKLYMLQRLNTFLLEELRGGGNVALLIDEAQDLEFSVLEDLRLLSNLETAKEKILQIVMSGQPELGQKLSNPVLRQLRQRIGINCRLLPLSRDEITEYINFRLQAAGSPDLKLFTREAEDQIYHFSRGIPRLVNVVCDNALVIGYALGRKRIGADVITEAAADLLPVEPTAEPVREQPLQGPMTAASQPTRTPWRNRLSVIGLVVVAAVIGVLSVGWTMLNRHFEEAQVEALPPAKLEVIRPGSQPNGTGLDAPPSGGRLVHAEAAAPPSAREDTTASGNDGGNLAAAPQLAAAPRVPRDPPRVAPGPPLGSVAAPPPAPAPVAGGADVSRPRLPADSGMPAAPERHIGPVRLDPAIRPNPELAAKSPPTPALQKPPVERRVELKPEVEPAPAVKPQAWQEPHAEAPQVAKAEIPAARAPEPQQVSRPALEKSPIEAVKPTTAAIEPESRPEEAVAEPEHIPGQSHLDGVDYAKFVVRPGDSLSEIARRKYGQSSYTVLDLLKIANPELQDIDVIPVGQVVRLPELREGFPVLNDGTGRYSLLVFSTPNAARAGNFQKALRNRGFDARVGPAEIGVNKRIFRVAVSGFGSRDEVTAVGRELQTLFREDTHVAELGE